MTLLDLATISEAERELFMNNIAERLGRIWDACQNLPAEGQRVEASADLTEVWRDVQYIESFILKAEAALKSGEAMLGVVIEQRDQAVEELWNLRKLARALDNGDLQDERVRQFAANVLADQGDYYELIEELRDEDRFDWLATMFGNKLGISRHTAQDLADMLTDDWSEFPPHLAAQLAQTLEEAREFFRGWK